MREWPQKKSQKTEKMFDEILAKDPFAFSYDEVLEDVKRNSKRNEQTTRIEPSKPRYLPSLIASADEREKNNNLLYQRKLQRELEEDRKEYGEETDKFLTPSYKRQLEENRKYEEQERKQLEDERKNDITKKGQNAWGSYYRNLLEQRNVAVGGTEESNDSTKQENDNKDNTNPTPKKRSRSPSPEDESWEERDRDRRKRNRERAEAAAIEAEKIRQEREEAKQKKIAELQEEYSKRSTDDSAVEAAKMRYLERQKMRDDEFKNNKVK